MAAMCVAAIWTASAPSISSFGAAASIIASAAFMDSSEIPPQGERDAACIWNKLAFTKSLDVVRVLSRRHQLLPSPSGGCPAEADSGERRAQLSCAFWYFRLNGFLQIENFVVHPERYGSQRTDADLLAIRFPHRAERLFDDPHDIMADDEHRLALSRDLTDVLIVEVKANQPCTLNGPWTRQDKQNVHRVLAAIGCLPPGRIADATTDIYRAGIHTACHR
jgi:hypothetical protein